ncbi:MAG: hypothetical protein GC178_13110 [Flavobacteriales bacterium]|nr:hypothetical protein [Flavobacteriales bacterium]
MKTKLFHSVAFGLMLLCASNGFSQTMYSSPEPRGSEPISVKKADAIAEAESVSDACGYNRAFISSDDLTNLLSPSAAVGVRIYNAKESSDQANCDIITVAVDANGKEIGPALTNKYLHAESYDENNSCSAKKISKSKATGCVSNVANSKLNYQKVFFSKSVLQNQLKVSGATGITIIPGQISGGSTMMIMAAKLENGKITELETDYLKSQLPCPTDCGDSGNYLVDPK